MTLQIADVNRYHELVDAEQYAAWSPVVIIEMDDGWQADNTGPPQRARAHAAAGIRSVGLYGYVAASLDAGFQGRRLATTIGRLLPGEFIAVDLEEGDGDQAPRMEAYLAAVHAVLHEQAAADFGYSDAAFWTAHLSQVGNVHRWIASLSTANPGLGNVLWQDTWTADAPGVAGPCDASLYAGSIDDWLALIGSESDPTVTVPQPAPTEGAFLMDPKQYPAAWVRLMYRLLLHREADMGGMVDYTDQLAKGTNPDTIIAEIQDSAEGREVLAAERRVLGLPALP